MKGMKPQLVVDNTPVNTIPEPPGYFGENAKAEWRRIMPLIIERQTINDADMGGVENYCIAQGAVRDFQVEMSVPHRQGTQTQSKYFRMMNQAMQTARQLAAELGLTPVSRARPTKKPRAGDDGDDPLNIS